MKNNRKTSAGITLIALVVTIIVLLILAGISIMMLTGDNGILQQTTNARTRTIHANVLEQIQLEALAYTVDKNTGNYSNSLIDYLKGKSIISDISGEETKWLINVTTLLGSNPSMGKGIYPNDVYVLEEQDTSTGSIVDTKVATKIPIKIAATSTTQITYKVLYYGNDTNENLVLGSLIDEPTGNQSRDYDKIYEYFYNKTWNDYAEWDDNEGCNVFKDNTTVGILGSELTNIGFKANKSNTASYGYIEYNNNLYAVVQDYNTGKVSDVKSMNIDKNTFGEYGSDDWKILITPIVGENTVLIHIKYSGPSTYYMLNDETDEDYVPSYTGYCAYDDDGYNRYYNTSGALVSSEHSLGNLPIPPM